MVNTQIGKEVAISTTAQNTDLDQAGFEGLTYTNIGQIGDIGESGTDTNILSYDTTNTDVTQKQKGISTVSDTSLECAENTNDPGQIAMRAAGMTSNTNNYAFKVSYQSGKIEYWRGFVTGPTSPNGGPEDFDLLVFNIAQNQVPVVVNP